MELLVSWHFQGDQKATLGRKGLIQVWTWPGKKWSILKTKCHCLCLAKTFFAALSANSKDLISSFTTFKKSLDVIPVLQIKIFQLTGNYKVRFEASQLARKHVKNQARSLTEVGTLPCKILGFFEKKTMKQDYLKLLSSQHITF